MKLQELPWRSNVFSSGVTLVCLGLIGVAIQVFVKAPEFNQLKVYNGKVLNAYSSMAGKRMMSKLLINTDDGVQEVNIDKCFSVIEKTHRGDDVIIYYEKLSPFQSYDGRIA